MNKTYNELIKLNTYAERFRYLKLSAKIGSETFGEDRYLNQQFYASQEWKEARRYVIIRDMGCDLGLKGYEIQGPIYVHHINPITADDIINNRPNIVDVNNLICVSMGTHNALHYGDMTWIDNMEIVERKPFDTCPWR